LARAVICPVCNGEGMISRRDPRTSASERVVCHGCGGLGWVEVSER